VKLLLDEMYAPVVAEQLRARGHDVVSVHDPEYRRLEGAPDEEIFAAALAEERALVTENVPDFRRLEAESLARGEAHAALIFTSNRQFPRGEPGTTGRLVEALHVLLTKGPTPRGPRFLKRPPSS
jgi:predicted nuclease of predicted toxin-antitoxin system